MSTSGLFLRELAFNLTSMRFLPCTMDSSVLPNFRFGRPKCKVTPVSQVFSFDGSQEEDFVCTGVTEIMIMKVELRACL